MTLQQTRQLGMEVERRLQTILPSFKIENKIDTEDIYAFLNQFQKQYIDAIYRQDDQTQSGTRTAALIEDILRTLTKHAQLSTSVQNTTLDSDCIIYELPLDYYKYIRSVSDVTGTYRNSSDHTKVSNVLAKQTDANKILDQYYDKNRILRNPVVILEGSDTNPTGTIKLIHDSYTTVNSIDLTYIKLPGDFSILTNTACELPYTCFEELVAGATELYVKHLTATQPKQQKKQEAEE